MAASRNPSGADERHRLSTTSLIVIVPAGTCVRYTLAAGGSRDRVISHPRLMAWMRRSFVATFVALGIRLALAER